MVDAWAGSYAQSADGSSRNINNGVIRKGKMIYEIEYTIIGKKTITNLLIEHTTLSLAGE